MRPSARASVCSAVALSAALATLMTSLGAAPATGAPTAGHQARRVSVDLRVASYNVVNVSVDRAEGERQPWRVRRQAVIANILGEGVDVIGVQEVNPSKAFRSRLVAGKNQFQDLKNGLNAAGGSFALTSSSRRSSHSDRILYDTRTIKLVKQGALRYAAQARGGSPDHLAWAVLRSRVNGTKFLFTSTHLANTKGKVKRLQWKQMIKKINKLRNGRPVIAVGDLNTHKFAPEAKTLLPRMKRAGYGDVLNQHYREGVISRPRAQSTVNGWMNTNSKFVRDVRAWSYWQSHHKAGNNIDWIFASNHLPVREWKVVTSWDPATYQVSGVIPSDHNMVRATLGLG
jgi:endonuclease/exonuclease/phosphatase family metal-dependent hydrolase